MVEEKCTVKLWCDTALARCSTSGTFEGRTRFDAVNTAREAGWYLGGNAFALCPVHDNARVLELQEVERRKTMSGPNPPSHAS